MGIDAACGFIKNHNRRICNCSPCNGQKLPLSLGQVLSVVGYDCIVAILHHHNKLMGICKLCSLNDIIVTGLGISIPDVLPYRSCKEVCILKNHCHGPSQVIELDSPDIYSVYGDGTLLDIIETVEKIGDGGFTGSGGPDKSNLLSWFCIKGNIVEDSFLSVIGEVYMIHYNSTL